MATMSECLTKIDAEIARLQADRAVLVKYAGGCEPAAPAAVEETTIGAMRAEIARHFQATGSNGTNGHAARTGGAPDLKPGRRRKAADLLARGPLGGREIARRTGIPAGSMGEVMAHPWFARTGHSVGSRFHLTDAGRAAVATKATA